MSSFGLNGHFTYHHSAGFGDNGALYTTLQTATIRNIMTTIFVLLGLAVGFVGERSLKAWSLRRLGAEDETKRRVPMSHLTSWVSLYETLTYAWRTSQLPGGFLGILMLLMGVLGLADQYFVNSFVVPVTLQGQCPFEHGLVTTYQTPSDPLVPSSTLCAAATIYNAQYDVWRNGGEFGIYQMINYTSTTFLPVGQDVIGYWNCSYISNSTIESTDWADKSSVVSFLRSQNFLFTEAFQLSGDNLPNSPNYTGFLAWSADQLDDSTEKWSVKATLANNLKGSSAVAGNLQCNLLSRGSWTPPTLPSQRSLTEWGNRSYGFLMGAEFSNYEYHLEWILNAMVMAAGSANTDQWNSSNLPVGASQTYGCTLEGTEIRPEIWAMLGAILVIFVPLSVAEIFFSALELFRHRDKDCCGAHLAEAAASTVFVPLSVAEIFFSALELFRHRDKDCCGAHLAEAAPSTVLEWQMVLLREAMKDDTIEERDVRDYVYGWDDLEKKYNLRRLKPSSKKIFWCLQRESRKIAP